MKIFIGADHAGFQLKEDLKRYLSGLGYEVEDMGAKEFDPDDDYPDFIFPTARAVAENPQEHRGIIIGGSGQGEVMCANKIKGIRAALVYDEYSARMSREHNDANIMSIGARVLDTDTVKKLAKTWLETPFSGEERHKRRLAKIGALEANQ